MRWSVLLAWGRPLTDKAKDDVQDDEEREHNGGQDEHAPQIAADEALLILQPLRRGLAAALLG